MGRISDPRITFGVQNIWNSALPNQLLGNFIGLIFLFGLVSLH